MITPDKKTKKKNILTAVVILAFMVFLFVFTLYNVGVFDRQL
ncbi:serine protease [Candidatus Pelagibacter bacterium nBUS_27]